MWRNDPLAIEMSINRNSVSEENHAMWFPATLNSDLCVHLIGEMPGANAELLKIGVCRFDREATIQWKVSINLNPAFRGHGLSEAFLGKSIVFWEDYIQPGRATLVAEAREENAASVKIFKRNGFESEAESAAIIRMLRKFG